MRPVVEADLPQLLAILREPSVARFWTPPDDADEQRSLLLGDDADGADAITTFGVTLTGSLIGCCQSKFTDS